MTSAPKFLLSPRCTRMITSNHLLPTRTYLPIIQSTSSCQRTITTPPLNTSAAKSPSPTKTDLDHTSTASSSTTYASQDTSLAPENSARKKSASAVELDQEAIKAKMEGFLERHGGGVPAIEMENGKPTEMKNSVRANLFRYI